MQEKVSSREAERLGLMPYSVAISLAMGPAMTMATVLLPVRSGSFRSRITVPLPWRRAMSPSRVRISRALRTV